MITILNRSKSVKIFKAKGLPSLRLFPGYNNVDMPQAEIEKYFQSDVGKAMKRENLSSADFESLLPEEQDEAEKAKEKNESLDSGVKQNVKTKTSKTKKTDKE